MTTPILVSTQWLTPHLGDPSVRVIDLRERGYVQGRLPGAVWLDFSRVNRDGVLSCAPEFAYTMSRLGVGDEHQVVVYGDNIDVGDGLRFCSALRRYGHAESWVLEGGYAAWVANRGLIERGDPQKSPSPASFTARSTWSNSATLQASSSAA